MSYPLSHYFDINGSTPVHPDVREAYVEHLTLFANPSASHPEGRRAQEALGMARAQIAAAIGAQPDEVFFTSGGTESNNWGLMGSFRPQGHMVVAAMEHKSVLMAARHMAEYGVEVTYVAPGRDGAVAVAEIERALRPNTFLVAVMFANNETGVLQPVVEIGALCRTRQIRFFCDAVCALGKEPIDVRTIGCDMLSLSSHKMYAPKGCGLLYLRQGVVLESLIRGCGQQQGRRSGTENLAGVAAFAKAFALRDSGFFGDSAQLRLLGERLWGLLVERIRGLERNGEGPFLANTLNLYFPGASAPEMVAALGARGFYVSAGAAASGGEPSHVLMAMGFEAERARSSLRFSLGAFTTEEAVSALADAVCAVYPSCCR